MQTGKQQSYTDYLAESTDTVRRGNSLEKVIEIGVFLIVWTVCLVLRIFCFNPDRFEMADDFIFRRNVHADAVLRVRRVPPCDNFRSRCCCFMHRHRSRTLLLPPESLRHTITIHQAVQIVEFARFFLLHIRQIMQFHEICAIPREKKDFSP